MELANIEKLLVKYENGETSLQEEQALKTYFQQQNIPEHLQAYKAMFGYFEESKAERFTKTIPLKSKKTTWKWLTVAASVALLGSIYFINNSSSSLSAAERKEAKLAYQETQKAFQLISKNLNKGERIAIIGLHEFTKTQRKVFKTTQK